MMRASTFCLDLWLPLSYPDMDGESILVPEFAELYKTNRQKYRKQAKKWTEEYAMPKQN